MKKFSIFRKFFSKKPIYNMKNEKKLFDKSRCARLFLLDKL